MRALPGGLLLPAERRHAAIRPGVHVHTVVGAIDDDGVVSNTELVNHLEQAPNVAVVFEHAIDVFAETAATLIFRSNMSVEMHARAIPPAEERFAGLGLPPNEVDGRVGRLVVDRLHAFLGEWSGVLNALATDLAETRIDRSIVLGGRFAFEHAARTEFLFEGGVLWIVGMLGLFFGIQVIEIAEKLVEPVHRWQELIAVA